MAPCIKFVITTFLAILLLVQSFPSTSSSADLSQNFHSQTCPKLFKIVREIVGDAISKDATIAKSLLLLFIHDSISTGCDASILLDDTSSYKGEKSVFQSQKSAIRNNSTANNTEFDVIDEIKAAVEAECPGLVSCADILAIAAKESVSLLEEEPGWKLKLGRRDFSTESDNKKKVQCPHWTPNGVNTSGFNAFGFSTKDVVSLFAKTGGHSMKQVTAYNETSLAPLTNNSDYKKYTLSKAIETYHPDLLDWEKTESIATEYSENIKAFQDVFSAAMIKMSEFMTLTGSQGEIRKNCSRMN